MNAQAKHTPGPWVIVEDPCMDTIRQDDEAAYLICEFPYGAFDTATDAANARLIAAAPDLLGLLQELIDIEGPQPGTAEWANKVRAAIAKATGEQP